MFDAVRVKASSLLCKLRHCYPLLSTRASYLKNTKYLFAWCADLLTFANRKKCVFYCKCSKLSIDLYTVLISLSLAIKCIGEE